MRRPSTEDDVEHGVSTSVTYFVLPDGDFATLVRWTIITNTGADAVTLSSHVGGEGMALQARGGAGRAFRAVDGGLHSKCLGGVVQAWLRL